MLDLELLFEKYGDEYLKFSRITEPLNHRPDIHLFLLLDHLIPYNSSKNKVDRDIISGAEHDKIYLDVNLEDLAMVATEDQIRDIVRCGGFVEEDYLCMFA